MSKYCELVRSLTQADVQEYIGICKKLLPDEYKHRPYRHPALKNGTNLLQTEDAMNAYMAAYGEMHIAKCRAALQNFPFEELDGTIEIVDWGCGQGVGSLCTLEALSQRGKMQWVKRVTLIEPSSATLERAVVNVAKETCGGVTIIPVNRYLPGSHKEDELDGVDYSAKHVIHVFSNILDVDGIDLARLARMIPYSGHRHYLLCAGPLNANAYRMDSFCKIFAPKSYFSQIVSPSYGQTSDTYYSYTCKTRCFVYDGSPLDYSVISGITTEDKSPVYSEYDPRLAQQNGIISETLRRLYVILLNRANFNADDFIILNPDINGDCPDIVVVRPNKGILIIKVFEEELKLCPTKDKTSDKGPQTDSTSYEESVCFPALAIMQEFQDNLIRLYLEDMIGKVIEDKRNWGIVKKMVLFAKNTNAEIEHLLEGVNRQYTYCVGKEFLTDEKMQGNLIYTLKFNYDNSQFDSKTLKSFLRIIKPSWHFYKEGKVVNLTTPQRHLVLSSAGKKQKISGVAGSGKTLVLATRAVKAQVRTGGKVLILIFNKSLVNFIRYRVGEVRADFPWNNIVIDYYHRFFRTQANKLGISVKFSSYNDESFFDNRKDAIERFSAIFVDEVQDYATSWLRILDSYFLEEDGEFVVFGDPKQNIYERPLDSNGDIRLEFIGGLWNHELKERQRFANPQLANLATAFQSTFYDSKLPVDTFEDTSQTSMFSRIQYINIGRTQDITLVDNAVRHIVESNSLSMKDTAILSQTGDLLRDLEHCYKERTGLPTTSTFISLEQLNMLIDKCHQADEQRAMNDFMFERDKKAIEHHKKLRFTMGTDFLKMSTVYSFKGWEATNIIFVLEPESDNQDESGSQEKYTVRDGVEDIPELIYTAITRARGNLFIINLGNDKYHDFFSSHIK